MKIETTVTFMTAPALPAGPKSFAIADTYRRRLSVAGPRQSFIAADPHVSGIRRLVRRCGVTGNGNPRCISEFLRSALREPDRFELAPVVSVTNDGAEVAVHAF